MLLIVKNDKVTHQANGFWFMPEDVASKITELAIVRNNACIGVYKVEDMLYNHDRNRAVFDIASPVKRFEKRRDEVTRWRIDGGKFGQSGWTTMEGKTRLEKLQDLLPGAQIHSYVPAK